MWARSLLVGLFVALQVGGASPAVGRAAQGNLGADFSQASGEFQVPLPILLAVSYAETRWDDHGSQPSAANGYGLMHLQSNPYNDGLTLAAAMLGKREADLVNSRLDNLRGGAALLRLHYVAFFPRPGAGKIA